MEYLQKDLNAEPPADGVSDTSTKSSGFTLVEVVVALVIIMVALLGVVFAISWSIIYNAGNANRAKTLAVLQQEVERLRSAKFTPAGADDPLHGTAMTSKFVTSGPLAFEVFTTVDNDPSTPDIVEDETAIPNANTSFKQITITTRLAAPSPGWQTAIPATVVLRRVKSN